MSANTQAVTTPPQAHTQPPQDVKAYSCVDEMSTHERTSSPIKRGQNSPDLPYVCSFLFSKRDDARCLFLDFRLVFGHGGNQAAARMSW